MSGYIPQTAADRRAMLEAVGVADVCELYQAIPESVRLNRPLDLPEGASEQAVRRQMETLAAKNVRFPVILRGAGAYNHYIPAIVQRIAAKEEFVTAYTPYQPEISQGVLQSIFEYQTMICALTGMDSANASVYDGASAAAEAAAMCRDRGRQRCLVSACVHPHTLAAVRSYAWAAGAPLEVVPAKNGVTDAAALERALAGDAACVILQQPNYYGCIEDVAALAALAHAAGAKCVLSANPIALAVLTSPADCGADIVVGEGKPLGLPLSLGGPYLGFMACRSALTRRLPGRIAGETVDAEGKRCYVLTLQAREQHIRREKAQSNICSNQALCALTAAVYMAAMGPEGLRRAAAWSAANARALADALCAVPGFGLVFGAPYFHEFVTTCPVNPEILMAALEKEGILGGLPVEIDGKPCIIWCATEQNSAEDIAKAAKIAREVCA